MADWTCPICETESDTLKSFSSDWALACHIAGKARTGDRLHRSWVRNCNPNIDFKSTLPKIAESIQWQVRESNFKASKQDEKTNEPYQLVANIEIKLHEFIKQTLEGVWGNAENEWWVKGVPLKIRKSCSERWEEAGLKDERFNYSYIVDLIDILDKGWGSFYPNFKCIEAECKTKKDFLDNLNRLNEIRNTIMHPMREPLDKKENILFLNNLDKLIDKLIAGN